MSRYNDVIISPEFDIPLEHAIKSLYILQGIEGFEDVAETIAQRAHDLFMEIPEKDGVRKHNQSGLTMIYAPQGIVVAHASNLSVFDIAHYQQWGRQHSPQLTVLLPGYELLQKETSEEESEAQTAKLLRKQQANFRREFNAILDSRFPKLWEMQIRNAVASAKLSLKTLPDGYSDYELIKHYTLLDEDTRQHVDRKALCKKAYDILDSILRHTNIYIHRGICNVAVFNGKRAFNYGSRFSAYFFMLPDYALEAIAAMYEHTDKSNHKRASQLVSQIEDYIFEKLYNAQPSLIVDLLPHFSWYPNQALTREDIYKGDYHFYQIKDLLDPILTVINLVESFDQHQNYSARSVLYDAGLIKERPKRPRKEKSENA